MNEESVQAKLNAYFARKSAVKGNLAIATILSIISVICSAVAKIDAPGIAMRILLPVLLWLAAICFFTHNVNGMQCSLGAFLGGQMFLFVYASGLAGLIGTILPLVFSVIAFITHQYLIAQRKSKGNALFINQLAGAIFMLACVVNCLVILIADGFDSFALARMFGNITTAAAMNLVITIETRINEYKIQRDAMTSAGQWNDGAKEKLKKEIFG